MNQLLWSRSIATFTFFCVFLNPSMIHAAIVTSTFDSGSEGWLKTEINSVAQIVGTSAINYSTTGGNPDGNIWSSDTAPTGWYFTAPAIYIGDKSGSIGGFIGLDTLTSTTTQADGLIHLRSTNMVLSYTPVDNITTAYTHYQMSYCQKWCLAG